MTLAGTSAITELWAKCKSFFAASSHTHFDEIYPVGSIYMSVNSTSPATLFGGTWERITGSFLLAATDNGSSGASQAAGNTGGAATVTLTAAQSGVPAHSHDLNSHTHGMNHKHVLTSHTHGLNGHTHTLSSHTHSLASHTHGEKCNGNHWLMFKGRTDWSSGTAVMAGFYASSESDADKTGGPSTNTSGTPSNNTSGKASGNTESYGGYTGNSITTGSSASAGNTGRTATDAASGSTANNTAANASSAHNNMPPYLSVYMWKRTA